MLTARPALAAIALDQVDREVDADPGGEARKHRRGDAERHARVAHTAEQQGSAAQMGTMQTSASRPRPKNIASRTQRVRHEGPADERS